MKVIKSIFDKSYIVKAQAEAAGAKEWPQGIPSTASLSFDEATRKFRWIAIEAPLVEWDESAEACQARVEALKAGLAALHPALAVAEMAMPADVLAEHGAFQALVADAAAAVEEFGEDELERFADEQRAAERKANAQMSPQSPRPRLSSCLGPTKKVWHIADSMPKASRKDVMAECVAQGIAYGTARTQYQAWFKASQNGSDGSARKPYEKA